MALAVLIVAAVFGAAIYGWVYSSRDHWSPKDGQGLKEDSKIIDVKSSLYNKYNFKTVITFDDGFQYIAFDTKTTAGAFRKTLSVTPEMKIEIIGRAMKKHSEILENKA